MFKPLRPTPAMLFHSRYLMLLWSVIVVLSGFLTSAVAQTGLKEQPGRSDVGAAVKELGRRRNPSPWWTSGAEPAS